MISFREGCSVVICLGDRRTPLNKTLCSILRFVAERDILWRGVGAGNE